MVSLQNLGHLDGRIFVYIETSLHWRWIHDLGFLWSNHCCNMGYSIFLAYAGVILPTDNDVTQEDINFHADTTITSDGGKNAGGKANISR